ncbi:hypothetical protein PACTADRAFT_45346 [Pachysolen tannophilus NRRL Y-2460]|uniref:1-acyl-sn-glycerol-3-phosphate acyltransferase n=1 Tax=Pachysolen tannophilus NRRL Y-2460 TaxID=669874 RepID=A0A1E4TQL0_PACTA|nr:hypothetical protein PACTADRAFT_45346 [Pachysolen tannophilus NRRL Y-2460]
MVSLFKKIHFYFKSSLALLTLLFCAVYGVLASVVLGISGKKYLSQWATARFFYCVFSNLFNIKIEVEHEERLQSLPSIIIGNHQSVLDILILGKIFPKGCFVTSKESLKYVPFLGWFMSLSGTFFINRSNRERAVRTLNNALEEMKKNKHAIFMFPEGTRSYALTPTLLPFKKGAFHMAVQSGIQIVPIVASNTSSLVSGKLYNFKQGIIKIKVLEPIQTSHLTKDDVHKLAENTRQQMLEVVNELGFSKVNGDDFTNDTLEQEATQVIEQQQSQDATTDADVTDMDTSVQEEQVHESTSLLSNKKGVTD